MRLWAWGVPGAEIVAVPGWVPRCRQASSGRQPGQPSPRSAAGGLELEGVRAAPRRLTLPGLVARAVAAAVEVAACGSKVGAAAADSGGRMVSRTGGHTSSRGATAAEQEAVFADVPE